MITRVDETNDFLKLVDVLKEGYVLDEKEFEDDWDYSSYFITTDLATLKDLKSNILVQVDKRSGKIDFLLENDSLAKLNSLENED